MAYYYYEIIEKLEIQKKDAVMFVHCRVF